MTKCLLFAVGTISSNCTGTYDEVTTTLKSPNISSVTLTNPDCFWNIQAPVDKSIILSFVNFQVHSSANCENASLQIFDGQNIHASRIGNKLCGNTLPNEMESRGQSLFLLYHSSVYSRADTFEISYEVQGTG